MKKALLLVLAVVMVVALFASCAQEAAPAPAEEAAAPAETEEPVDTTVDNGEADGPKFTIGYLGWSMEDEWNQMGMQNFVACADKYGWEVIVNDCQKDAEVQVSQAETMINQGVDCLTVFPTSTESASTIIKMANEAGIPIAVENAFMDDSAGEVIGQIACQYADIGYAAIKWAAENVEDAKCVYVQGGLGLGVAEDYAIGVDQAFKDFADKIVEVGNRPNGNWEAEASYNVMDALCKDGTEFNVVFANNDLEAQGIYNALKENGKEDIPIISTGGSAAGYELFEQGIEAANMTAPVSIQGAQLFKFCYQKLMDEPIEETKIPLAVIPVDQTNPEDWMFWDDFEAAQDYVGI